MTNERPQGALNIYSSKQHAFGTREQKLAALFANQALEILTTAGSDITERTIKPAFRRCLGSASHDPPGARRDHARNNLTADHAINSLFRAARSTGITVLSYATEIVASVHDDGEQQ